MILVLYNFCHAQAQLGNSFTPTSINYPRITGYVGIIHPLVNITKDGTTANFNNSYTVGMPTGINIIKSAKIGFSIEVTPFIRVENGISKMNNLLFHPGVLMPLGNGFTLVGRAAFETSGRFGFTPILNKVVKKNKNSNYFIAIPLPVRFGNDRPSSFTAAFQFGIGF
ncbi:hypothetical protein FA046_10630 [Pedobacter cryophilus]|uniref:Outer membrane protein beta-barrel domain-containing protein n=1 Tax=Pedobacter cryophilus TaxID=2571271 RepID=A0A4V6WMW8_9SPHI|nr:hypothetical protein FA046_10630 [Pedobacter cryophilus]